MITLILCQNALLKDPPKLYCLRTLQVCYQRILKIYEKIWIIAKYKISLHFLICTILIVFSYFLYYDVKPATVLYKQCVQLILWHILQYHYSLLYDIWCFIWLIVKIVACSVKHLKEHINKENYNLCMLFVHDTHTRINSTKYWFIWCF